MNFTNYTKKQIYTEYGSAQVYLPPQKQERVGARQETVRYLSHQYDTTGDSKVPLSSV